MAVRADIRVAPHSLASNERYFVVKRGLDIVIAAALLIALSPFIAIVAIAVKLSSPGPIFYRQKRIGLGGEPFEMLKFRSMYHNVSSATHEQAIVRYMRGERLDNSHTTGSPYKLGDDSRITRIGKFIRKTSIDELPQLWNVIRGEMSMVGPRPPIPYEVTHYNRRAMRRLDCKPGITGPWQVNGRGRVTFYQMVEMDIEYLHRQSVWYDLKLIILTVPVVLLGVGGV